MSNPNGFISDEEMEKISQMPGYVSDEEMEKKAIPDARKPTDGGFWSGVSVGSVAEAAKDYVGGTLDLGRQAQPDVLLGDITSGVKQLVGDPVEALKQASVNAVSLIPGGRTAAQAVGNWAYGVPNNTAEMGQMATKEAVNLLPMLGAKGARRPAETAAGALEIGSLGISPAKAAQKFKETGVWVDDGVLHTKNKDAIREVVAEGKMPLTRNSTDIARAVGAERERIGGEIGNIVSVLDSSGVSPLVTFKNAEKVVQEAPLTERARLSEDLNKYRSTFTDAMFDATQKGEALHAAVLKEKTAQGLAYKKQIREPNPSGLDARLSRALERDLREAIDRDASSILSPEQYQAYKELNRRYGNYKTVEQMVDEAAVRNDAKPWFQNTMAMMRTSGGVGSGALAAALSGGSYPAMIAGGLALTSKPGMAAQASLMRGLAHMGSNPYLALAPISRSWDDVKDDPAAKEAIAMQLGIPTDQFGMLPENKQKLAHAQVILSNPQGAEPAPGGYQTLVNNRLVDPTEIDEHMAQAMKLPARDRAGVVGALWDNNKFKPLPEQENKPMSVELKPQIDIDSVMSNFDVPQADNLPLGNVADEMVGQLNKAIGRQDHARSG
jgi:hypothetical protein